EPYLRAPAQSFVRVPFATHTVLLNSPVKTPGLATCGGQMIDAFLRDPSAPPAAGCLGDLEPPSFTRPAAFAEGYFKQGDVWENDPALPAARAAASPARRLEPPARRPERLGR
ncbi:MAG TPA: hypothetical protein VFS00_10950, partial [Polyangiaceae bacterium]|nr:hypothetical protein [Polyangiaceae bacterium]